MAACKTGMKIQSILFDRAQWTAGRAKKWLRGHGAKTPKVDATADNLRFRQAPPFHFKKGSFRTKTLDQPMGIKAVVACPLEKYRRNPLPTIVAMNPRKGKKKTVKRRKTLKAKTGGRTMAKKKTRKRRSTKRRRNPSRARTYARTTFAGVQFQNALKTAVPMLFGAVAAKFAAKRFADGGGEMEDWTWKNHLLGLVGALVAGIAASALLKTRGNIAQNIFTGGLVLILYKIWTLEIAPKNPTLSAWFGGDEDMLPGNEYGQLWQGDEVDYMTGADGFYRPVDESHRLPEAAGYGDVVTPATPTLGDVVVPATPALGADMASSRAAVKTTDVFRRAYG